VNVQRDRTNCGDCGNQCPPTARCEGGVCTCDDGERLCDGQCVDLQTDETNCGDCGHACPDGVDCLDGVCSCPEGQILCGLACVDPLTDNANCGGCDIACAAEQACTVCNTGVCEPLCGLGTCPETCRGICDPCDSGPGLRRCEFDSDCLSGNCDGVHCDFAETCFNGVQDGFETGVDCGGGACPGCDGEECGADRDCASGVCRNTACQVPTCSDDVRNGGESDVDCGGPVCPKCADGLVCRDDDDCESGQCNPNSICGQGTCTDGSLNGEESDIDCGGPDCPPCENGRACFQDSDCESNFCDAFGSGDPVCRTPTCDDLVRNGLETDLDCGGPECPPCEDGSECLVDDDCESGVCNEAGLCGACARPCRNSSSGELVDCCGEEGVEFCAANGFCFPCSISPGSCQ
jgi:hypothetical protein